MVGLAAIGAVVVIILIAVGLYHTIKYLVSNKESKDNNNDKH